jgi:paraquat-inducible protein A
MLTHRNPEGKHTRAKVYHYIHTFGRWSMVDIFLLSVLVAVGQLGALASVTAMPGGLYFCLVFLCTIFAVASFDARLIWDEFPEAVLAEPEPRKA